LAMGGNTSEAIIVPGIDCTKRFDPVLRTVTGEPQLAYGVRDRKDTAPNALRDVQFLRGGGGMTRRTVLRTPSPTLSHGFDPARGGFVRSGDLQRIRSGDATATLLADGRVLVTGGGLPDVPFSEIYDPATGQWEIAGDLQVARRGHTATLLADSRVLVAGGIVCCTATGETFTDSAEIYDPASGRSQLTNPLRQGRRFPPP